VDVGPDLEVPTVASTTESAWSAQILPGTVAAVDGTVVSFAWDENGEQVLSGAAADTGEVVWELGDDDGDAIRDTTLSHWLTPRPMTIQLAEVGGVPAVIANAMDSDLGDAAPECEDDAEGQHAVVAIAAATGEILWTAHPAPPSAENSCNSFFERDLVVTEDTVVVNGTPTGGGGGSVSVAMSLHSGEVRWTHEGFGMTRTTSNAIIGVRNLADTAEARCGFEFEYLYSGFDPGTGEALWELDPCEDPSILGVLSDQVLVETGEGASAQVRALDARTGEVLASYTGAVLQNVPAADGDRLLLCFVPVEGGAAEESAMLLYDAAAAAFSVPELAPEAGAGFAYLIWEGQLAVHEDDEDVTVLYDLESGSETARFPGWWAGSTGAYRLSTPPEYMSDLDARLDVYTAAG
jgi:outer membrane protein assembly factor BamB